MSTFFSEKALYSVPWLLFSRVVTFFLYFAISILVVRGLTPDEYGVFSILRSLSEYGIVFGGLGLNFALLRFIPELVIHNNTQALKKYLLITVFIELIALTALSGGIFLSKEMLEKIFHFSFDPYIFLIIFFIAMLLIKEFINNVLTAIYYTRLLSILSVVQALILISLLFLYGFSVSRVILSYGISIGIVSIISIFSLCHYLYQSGGNYAEKHSVESFRVFKLACPTFISKVLNKIMEQYSEIFFLGYFATSAIVGYYALGVYLPQIVITFIPLTLHSLFTSAFSETYSKDHKSLPNLISGLFQILIVICLPIAFFGVFFGQKVVIWMYGEKMSEAGYVAAFFFFFKFCTLIWIPLSIALVAKEKVAQTLWLEALTVILNLILDYFLIKNFGIRGAVGAVFLTFLITLPMKLLYIRSLIGTLSFPLIFFLKMASVAALLITLFAGVFNSVDTWGLIPLSIAYYFFFFFTLKIFKVVRTKDVERFRSVQIEKLNTFLNFMVGV